MMHWKTKESGRTETFALVCFILASVISVDAFQIPKNSLTHHIGVGHKSTSLAVSLATPAVNATGFANEDDDSQGREIQIKIKKEVDPFYKFLKNLSFRVKKKTTLAISMDDELKQLETIYYNLAPHDAHKNFKFSYNGPRVRPDARCYSLVCNSYANAGFGEKGAHLAESAMQRYEEHDGLKSNSFLMTAVMKAWIAADNWEKADFLLQEMENTFAKTQDPDNAPSAKTYTTYISGLSMTKKLDKKEAARKSVKMLDKMLEQYDSGKNPLARPNRFTYSYAMKCQTNAYRGIEGVNRAEKFFRQQQADYDKYNIVSLKPGAISALPVFTASNHCYGSIQAATRMEKILEELQEKYDKTGDTDYRPLEPMYTSLLSTYAKVDGNNAKKCSKEVDKVLEAIEQNGIEPSAHTITSAMNAKTTHVCPQNVKQAEELMRTMKHPDKVAYKCLINAYCRVGNAEKADELLGELQEGANRPDTMDSTFADVITLALIVKTWSIQRKKFDQAIERAEAQLQEIINRYREGEVGPYEKHVDTWVFECVARIWLASKKPEAGERIEDLINRMADLHEEVPGLFHPSLNVYILALDAWASSGRGDAGKHALALLRKMRGLHRAGELPEPNIRTLSTAFTSVIQSPSRGAVKKAERLYQEILDLYQRGDRSSAVNARTLTTLLSAIFYSKTDDAIVRAMKVLRQTVSLGKKNSHLAPNSITFNACLNGLAQRRASDGAWVLFKEMKSLYSKGYDTRPDNVSYACVVRAVASSKRSPGEAMKRLDSLCSEITEAWERGELHPDIKLFNTMINSYNILSKFDPTAAEKANSLLVRLELSDLSDNHISPDLRTFRYVCHAYAVSKAPGSLQKAEETLRRAQSLAAEGRIESPDTDIYSSVVLAHTRSQEEDSLEKAEHLVESMEQLQKEGHAKAKPNTETYNILLSAYASSRDYQKVTKSLATIRIMNKAFGEGQKACEPDVNSYNWVILTAARHFPSSPLDYRETFEVALSHFKALHTNATSANPNCLTYEFFLKACNRLLPEGETRSHLVIKALELCRQRGLVTAQVCREAYKCDSQVVLERLDATPNGGMEDIIVIPDGWCDHVPHSKQRNQTVALRSERDIEHA